MFNEIRTERGVRFRNFGFMSLSSEGMEGERSGRETDPAGEAFF
jgi:hypothetical protein